MQTKRLPKSVRPKAAAEILGISLPTFWRWAAERHDFPKLRRLSARCTVADTEELLAYRDRHIVSKDAG